MAALSTFTDGALFRHNTQIYVRTDQTGTSAQKIVCYNTAAHNWAELDETTDVTAVTLTTDYTPTFSFA